MTLEVDISTIQGALDIEAKFTVAARWTCLFGASGSGKTTILRAIAGLTKPRHSRILLDGIPMSQSRHTESPIWIPPHRRPVRVAAQQAWLFPGTVRDNVRYGAQDQDGVGEVLRRLRLDDMATKRVEALSGGQRQRVSLARAVAAAVYGPSPVKLLLLDEPFTGMDLALKNDLANELNAWLSVKNVAVLSVTHDAGEAFLLGAEVVRIAEGQVIAQGAVSEVLADERARLQGLLECPPPSGCVVSDQDT